MLEQQLINADALELAILVADPNQTVGRSLKARIEQMGHSAQCVYTCDDLLSRLDRENFDLLLLDLNLSGNETIQLIPRIRIRVPEINVVTMTDASSRKLEQEARENRIIYFFLKPINCTELSSLVQHIHRRKQLLRPPFKTNPG